MSERQRLQAEIEKAKRQVDSARTRLPGNPAAYQDLEYWKVRLDELRRDLAAMDDEE